MGCLDPGLSQPCTPTNPAASRQAGHLQGCGDCPPSHGSHSPSLRRFRLLRGGAVPNDKRRMVPHLQRDIFGRTSGEETIPMLLLCN